MIIVIVLAIFYFLQVFVAIALLTDDEVYKTKSEFYDAISPFFIFRIIRNSFKNLKDD